MQGSLLRRLTRFLPLRRSPHLNFGRDGERAAERYLRGLGWTLLERNTRLPGGEIDLIMEEMGTGRIIFVEVKARSDDRRPGHLAVTPAKQRRLRMLAQRLARQRRWTDRPLRIDVVEVQAGDDDSPHEIRHFRNAVTLTAQ